MEELNKYSFTPAIFVRAPFYSHLWYDLDRVPDLLQTIPFQNALWLASPGFYRVLSERGFDFCAMTSKERFSVYKYYNRMCFRPTPFGSFATFSLAQWSKRSPLLLAPDEGILMYLLPDLPDVISAPKKNQTLSINPLLYPVDSHYRLIRSDPDAKGKYRFSISALSGEPFYKELINWLNGGSVTREDAAAWIAGWADCTLSEANEQLAVLLDTQVLRTLQPELIGRNEPLIAPPKIEESGQLRPLSETKETFYAATERPPVSGGLPESDRAELEHAILLLQRLARPSEIPAMTAFINAFRSRFDQSVVPLLEALDPDTGIVYNNLNAPSAASDELLSGLHFPPVEAVGQKLDWSPVHRLLFKLWKKKSAGDHYAPLQLTETDLAGIDGDGQAQVFPPTIAVMFRKTEDGLLLEQAGGATATALIGRFSVFSESVASLCRELAAYEIELNPKIVFADIGQLSDTHVDNVNRRSRIYPYEIPLNAGSSLASEFQLPPADLELCVRNNELILFARSLKRRVVPRLASAFNHRNSDFSIFQLLCDLQYHHLCASLSLDLETLFPGLDYYPRVSLGPVILSAARWNFDAKDFSGLLTEDNIVPGLKEFCSKHQLPNLVSMGSFDQQLVFNLSHPPEATLFLQALKGMQKVSIREYLPPDRSVKTGVLPLAAQCVAFLKHPNASYRIYPYPADVPAGESRRFLPGGEWLYLKIFCTPVSADRLLCDLIHPFIAKYRQSFDHWFFIRFNEGGDHLRLRFKTGAGSGHRLLSLLTMDLKRLGLDHLAREIQLESYYPEFERYGRALIEQVELLFYTGSALVMQYLVLSGLPFRTASVFGLAFHTARRAVEMFIPGQDEAISFCRMSATQFLTEFKADKGLRTDLDAKYRALVPEISAIEKAQWLVELAPYFSAWEAQLQIIRENTGEGAPAYRLLRDLLHMQFNRTFQADQRKSELLVYHCLVKYLSSLKARKQSDAI